MHKGKERGLLGQFMEHGDHVVSCEATTLRFQRADNLFQTSHVPCQTFLNTQQKVRTITIYDNAFRLCIPFLCKDLVICIQLTDYSVVDNLEIETSLLAIHCGWSELYHYWCHIHTLIACFFIWSAPLTSIDGWGIRLPLPTFEWTEASLLCISVQTWCCQIFIILNIVFRRTIKVI